MSSTNMRLPIIVALISTACVVVAAVYTMYSQKEEEKPSSKSIPPKPQTTAVEATNSNPINVSISPATSKAAVDNVNVPIANKGPSIGLNVNNNQNLFALSSASKMNKQQNKIPRGATGIMPGKPPIHGDKKKVSNLGFTSKVDSKPQTVNTTAEEKEYDVKVTQPPDNQMKELEDMDDSKMHPRMRRDAPTTDINVEYLTPEMDKQRRRESVVLDEDGEEFQQIVADREERMKIEEQRNADYQKDIAPDMEEENEEEFELDMGDLDSIPNLSGLTRLQTDPAQDQNGGVLVDRVNVNVMPYNYRCSLSTGVYGFYSINNNQPVQNDYVLVEPTVDTMPSNYRCSLSTGVYGFYSIQST